MKKIFARRVFPGFRIGEGLVWLAFHISWAVMLGGLYYFTGQFDQPNFLSAKEFVSTQAYVLLVKAAFILPLWWLYFIRLQKYPLLPKLLLHVLTGVVFTLLTVGFIYFIKAKLLHGNYPFRSVVGDVYSTLIFYYSHFALFHAYNFWLDTKRRLIREQELKDLAHQGELKALKSQIEPHFLFNTLNSISASVPKDQEKTRVLIAQLADTFRYALKVSEQQHVSLEEELEFIRTWLSLEQHRFHERLNVEYRIDPACLRSEVPPMILQPIVENALNHGISPKINGGTVTIECTAVDNFVRVAVSDTGVGYHGELDDMFRRGIGLKNISRRLELLYNENLRAERNGKGLTFSFKLPLETSHEKKSDPYRR